MSTCMQGDMEGKGDNYPKKNPIFICDNYQVALVMTQKLFKLIMENYIKSIPIQLLVV